MKKTQFSSTIQEHYAAPECEMSGIIGADIICTSAGLGISEWEEDPEAINA